MHHIREMILSAEYAEAQTFLAAHGLLLPEGITRGLGIHENGALIATGFLSGNVICGICVSSGHQGEGLASSLVSRLVDTGRRDGHGHLMLFTKPTEMQKFRNLGFRIVASAETAALLEFGRPDFQSWVSQAGERLKECFADPGSRDLAAVVMNANPFTLGHRHLAETASLAHARVAVFVVEEDVSVFPFPLRLRLVKEGLRDLANVAVLPGGPYMVSRASFPAYFTGMERQAAAHAELDATIFASRIAPELGIVARYVGSEPYCPVTDSYNAALERILPRHGIGCVEVTRLAMDGHAVSASAVRAILGRGDRPEVLDALQALVPPSTYEFLTSDQARPILKALQKHNSRH